MKKLFLAILVCLPLQAFSQWSMTGGFTYYEVDADGFSSDAKLGVMAGGLYSSKFGQGDLRTGVVYTQRKTSFDLGGFGDYTANLVYFDIPAIYVHNINQSVSFIGGPLFSMNIDDDDVDGLENFFISLRFGANFTLNKESSLDAFYEMNVTEVGEDADGSGLGFAYVHKL